jgi:penicillin-binding protein 1A
MQKAVERRPVEKFETEVTLPEWMLESDEEAYLGNETDLPLNSADAPADSGGATTDEDAEYRRILDEATRRDAAPQRSPSVRRDVVPVRPTQPSRPNQ